MDLLRRTTQLVNRQTWRSLSVRRKPEGTRLVERHNHSTHHRNHKRYRYGFLLLGIIATAPVNAQDVGNGRELLSAQISGESLDIAFNIKYLMDGIKAIGTSEIQMQLNAALSPVILTPVGGLKMTYLIMPVQIRG